MAQSHTARGGQFRTKAEYEAALRDKKKIEKICSVYNLKNPKAVLDLHQKLQTGTYPFETALGKGFVGKVAELAKKYGGAKDVSSKTVQGGKETVSKGGNGRKGKAAGSGMGAKAGGKDDKLSLEDFDKDMQREIAAQLKARDRKRKLLVALCTAGAVICFGYFIAYYYMAEKTDMDYEQLASLKNSDVLASPKEEPLVVRGQEEEVELPDVLNEYKTLYNKNKRLIGWLKIDDTIIDYPVMQTSNNEYYLDHNFNQEKDNNGSIFMDKDCVAYPRSQNLILYGHHMRSGKMFGDLEKYSSESYYKKHSIIQFDTIYEKGTYQVMYVFRAKVLKENEIAFKYYQFIDANSAEEFDSYMREMKEMSLYDTGVSAQYGEELLTLSTCDHSQTDGRFVVVAKRVQ